MEEKRYLKWYNKVGYGSGDFAGNVVYAFLSSFVMLYLTNTVGLNPGIIGTLIMVSKLFDGISDMFFGTMIDKTKSRLGKARPWMLYAYIGCAVTLVANFAIPDSLGTTAQYVWFFIAYTLLNAVFFTANNIAYASLVTFCTKNSRERVEMGSWRFIFAFSTSLLIQSVTVQFVRAAGGGAAAWRTVAVVYAIIGLIVNTISVFSIKELPEEELKAGKDHTEEKYGLIEAAKLLFSNKYYLMICATYICQQIYSAMLNMGIYYMIYILKNENLYSVFSWAINIPVIVAMCITPMLVEKMKGLYRMNFAGYVLGTVGRVGAIGISNFQIGDIESLLETAEVKPMVNQILLHISNTPLELVEYCQKRGIVVEAYSPIAHGEILNQPEIKVIADKYGVTIPQLCIRYTLQLGVEKQRRTYGIMSTKVLILKVPCGTLYVFIRIA